MNRIIPSIESTDDGSQTLRHPSLHEAYHSLRGAVGEALHVYIEAGFCFVAERTTLPVIRIFEMGFGSGLNAWLTAQKAAERGWRTEYYAIEQFPVEGTWAKQLGYGADPLFCRIQDAPWNELVNLTPWFALKKIEGSLLNCSFDTTFDLIYFDAFAPDVQPELWSSEVFARLYQVSAPQGVLVTYSAKGEVKRNLRTAGFEVHRLPGALGKHHMIRAMIPSL